MSNVKSVKVVRLDSQLAAFGYLCSYAFFVITHPLTPVSLLTIGLLGYNGFSLSKYFTSEQAKVEVAKPLTENASFSLIPEAIAQEKPNPNGIYIGKKLYGYFDPDVECWKIAGKPLVLIHQKSTGSVFTVGVDALEPDRMKSFK
jgi:hypothetical protein